MRRNKPSSRFFDLPPIEVVLMTQDHDDSMDLALLERLLEETSPGLYFCRGNDR